MPPAKKTPKTSPKKAAPKKKTPAKSTKAKTAATTSKKASPKKSSKAKAKVNPVVQQSIHNDRGVELRGYHDLNAYTVVQVQQALMVQRLAKHKDDSSVKLYLGPADANRYRLQDQAALADTMVMVPGTVDTIVRSALDVDCLKAFLSATGKRFMTAGAELYIGVIGHKSPYDKNRAQQVRRKLFNDYARELMLLVHNVSGETNLNKIYDDLLCARGLSAMEALYYGENGLIDGILIDDNRVITRPLLEKHIEETKLTGKKLIQYLRQYINIYKIPTEPVGKKFKTSVASGVTSFYVPMLQPKKPQAKAKKQSKTEKNPRPRFYRGKDPIERLALMIRPNREKPGRRLFIAPLAGRSQSILTEDTIFFQDGFIDETAQQIGDALRALDHKKSRLKDDTHIKLIVNSPGGSVWSGQELRSLLKTLRTPVDIISTGMAASCGSWLLSSATGHRFVTPQARIMIHEAATQLRSETPHNHYNEMHDDLDQSTQNYVAIVADATGRPFPEVLEDFDLDVWFNPLEALFYGPKGLIDGVIVGPDSVITRKDAELYLKKTYKNVSTNEKLAAYVQAQWAKKRDPRQMMAWQPNEHDLDDPFSNATEILYQLQNRPKAKLDFASQGFKKVLSRQRAHRSIDYFTVVIDD